MINTLAKIDRDDLSNQLVQSVQRFCNPANLVAGNKELKIRCPYCGDSIKSAMHTHMYIGLDQSFYFPYYCQRCNTGGIVDRSFLKDINVLDYGLIGTIESFNKNNQYNRLNANRSSNSYTVKNLLQRKPLILPAFKGTAREKAKLNYVNSRYSFNRDPEYYIENYKMIFSFKQFIQENEIEDIFIGNDYLLADVIRNYYRCSW